MPRPAAGRGKGVSVTCLKSHTYGGGADEENEHCYSETCSHHGIAHLRRECYEPTSTEEVEEILLEHMKRFNERYSRMAEGEQEDGEEEYPRQEDPGLGGSY